MAMAPGAMFADQNRQTTITELITAGVGKAWGINDAFDYIQMSPFGMSPKMPERYPQSFDQRTPIIAAHVTGQMPHAFGSGAETAVGEEPDPNAIPQGALSSTSVNVIVLSDVDMAGDMFAGFYRSIDERSTDGQGAILASLGNVQFLGNAVDFLSGNESLTEVRTRKPIYRRLAKIDAEIEKIDEEQNQQRRKAEERVEQYRDDANAAFQAAIDAASAANARGDSVTEAHRREAIRRVPGVRKLEAKLVDVNEEYEATIARLDGRKDAAVSSLRTQVKVWAILLPALVIGLLVLIVWVIEVNERMDVPANRRRSN